MNIERTLPVPLTLSAAAILAACFSQPAQQPITVDVSSSGIPSRKVDSQSKILSDYSQYEGALEAAKRDDDVWPQQLLAQVSDSAMAENARSEWLENLGYRGQWVLLQQEHAKLDKDDCAQEVQCYADLNGGNYVKTVDLVRETKKLPQGCTRFIESTAASGRLNGGDAWRHVRGLLGNSQTTDARNLAAALDSPFDGGGQGMQEYSLLSVIGKDACKSPAAAAALAGMESGLSRAQSSYAWDVLGYCQALSQDMPAALGYYSRAAEYGQLSDEQWEWYTRTALRLQRWSDLAAIIQTISAKPQSDPTWQYQLARSLSAQGDSTYAAALYEKAAASGRNFYALLSAEELGRSVSTCNTVGSSGRGGVKRMEKDGAINHALALFKQNQTNGDWKVRRQAQIEWRLATRGFNEDNLLAAAQAAFNNQFYDMAVNSADRTDTKLNFNLRYPASFKETTERYATQTGIDPAWVYGLIRQESRFAMGTQSSVGAQGLMQVMPATTREIAGKIGMNSEELCTMDGNIRMGIWYMSDVKRRLQNSEVMTTAGYNAGPARARSQQAATPLEGSIYAGAIPFTETCDYVKKVMTNATYYASLFNERQTSLKQYMGAVPARY